MTFKGGNHSFVLLSIIFSLIAAVVLAEWCLGMRENYARQAVLDFADTKRFQGLGWGGFLKENLNIYVTDGLGGKVRWTNNAAGFRSDKEFTPNPAPGVLRLLSLGDSFNAGYRVGQDETLSHWQDEWLNRHYGPAEILVAETADPVNALAYLDRFGLKLKPRIVLLGITLGNDIVQAYQELDAQGQYILTISHGQVHIEESHSSMVGFDTLAAHQIPPDYLQSESPAGRFIRRAGRWLQRRSLLRRFYQQHEAITSWGDRDHLSLFDPNNGFGVFTKPLTPEIEKAYLRLFRTLTGFALLCRQHGIIFAVQIFPQRYQVQPEDWTRAVEEYGLKASRFNLMTPNQKIAAFCRAQGIICIDPTAALAQRYARTGQVMYLPRGDMHWNKEGHLAFFEESLPAFKGLLQAGLQKAGVTAPQALSPDKTSPGAID